MKTAAPGQVQADTNPDRPHRSWAWLGWGVALLLGAVAYAPTLWQYFTGEDFVFIKAAADGTAFYEPTQRLFYRPLPNLLWQLDYSLWGLNAGGYHLTNLLLHLLNSWLVGLLAHKLTGNKFLGYVATGLFALHPVHIEAVTWLASRPDLLATFFCLLSALCFFSYFKRQAGARPLWLYLLSVLFFAAGLFSKEAAAAWPLALLAVSSFKFLVSGSQTEQQPILNRLLSSLLACSRRGVPLSSFLLVGALYGWARWQALGGLGGYNSAGKDLLYIGWNLTGGLWLPLLFPINLKSAGTLVAVLLAGLVGLIYAGLVWNRLRSGISPQGAAGQPGKLLTLKARLGQALASEPGRAVVVGLILMYISLLPALNTAPVNTTLAQSRLLYLPSVGFCLLLAGLVSGSRFLVSSLKISNSFPSFLSPRLLPKGSSSLLFPLSSFLFLWQLVVLQVNLAPWGQAGELVRETFSELAAQKLPFKDGDTVYFEGLPDSYKGAYGWRNGVDAAAPLFTGRRVEGFNQTEDLRIDYRRNDSGRLWFLRYRHGSDWSNLTLASVYNVGGAGSGLPGAAKKLVDWDLGKCDKVVGWEWKPLSGQMQCQPGNGWLFDTGGQKTAVSGRSSVFRPENNTSFYLDLAAYGYFDFEQPEVLAEARLVDAENGQDLGGFEFTLAADGKPHNYRLYLKAARPTSSMLVTLKSSKVRTNILWQNIALSQASSYNNPGD